MSSLWILVLSYCLIARSMDFSGLSFLSVKSGESLSLSCPLLKTSVNRVVWYKQLLGQMPQKVGERLAYEQIRMSPEFETSGFRMETNDHTLILTNPHIKRDDGGLYYCEILTWENFTQSNGTFLHVTGGEDVKVSVFQSGVSDLVPAGTSVTLQCSVLSESRAAELQVLWFRAAPPQSHPQIIYTHHNSSHQCESSSSTHTCVYNFSKNILSVNDTGTYYCAVAVCGKIIFGNGTRLQLNRNKFPEQCVKGHDSAVICLAVALAVCVVVILVQAVVSCKNQSRVRPPQGALMGISQGRDAAELNYAAINFYERKSKSGKAKKRQPQDTVYTEVVYTPVS